MCGLTQTRAALIVEVGETVEALSAAGAVRKSALASLGQSAFRHDGGTHSLVAAPHPHHQVDRRHSSQGYHSSHVHCP